MLPLDRAALAARGSGDVPAPLTVGSGWYPSVRLGRRTPNPKN
jgi:hypothetical protein